VKTFKWSTTLLLLAFAAALISLIVFLELTPANSLLLSLAALALLLAATLFGKRGV
jgi:hypothetical protein